MIIDLHIHSKCSDGAFTVERLVKEAKARNIGFMSITDHDSIASQKKAKHFTEANQIRYISGVELNVTFSHSKYHEGKPISLDFLGYQFDENSKTLKDKLQQMSLYRKQRASKIVENLNAAFKEQGIKQLETSDFEKIQASADGTLGRPHIADYLVKKRIVGSRKEAFDKYLVACDVPKFPLYVEEASKLVRNAGGKFVLAHPNDHHGTSLISMTKSLHEQTEIIRESMLPYIDGIECWHSRNDSITTNHYVNFAKENGLIMTGGSDCHQKPILMGTIEIPIFVTDQFRT
jgi:predicted metal-dependent phosphoesterase TrpH